MMRTNPYLSSLANLNGVIAGYFRLLRFWWISFFIALASVAVCHAGGAAACVGDSERSRQKINLIEQEWPIRGFDTVTESVQVLASRLIHAVTTRSSTNWHIRVIRDTSVNAFAVGNGFIYITEGAVGFAQHEDQLVAILAHEMGHQLAGHFCSPPKRGFFGGLFGHGGPSVRRRGIGSLTQVIDLERELEADRVAVNLLSRAGYNPHALLTVAERLPVRSQTAHVTDRHRKHALRNLVADIAKTSYPDSDDFYRLRRELGHQ